MAKSFSCREMLIPGGHTMSYRYRVYRLDTIRRMFYPFEYRTRCPTVPSSWEIKLICERVPGGNDFYNFSIKVNRVDHSDLKVKVSIFVGFFDAIGMPVHPPIEFSKDGVKSGDELERAVYDVPSVELGDVICVSVIITIECCHEGIIPWHCASKVNTDKNIVNLSKL